MASALLFLSLFLSLFHRSLNGSLPSNVEIKNNTLFFKGPVTYDLAGTYVCDATNGIGTRTGIVDVNITGRLIKLVISLSPVTLAWPDQCSSPLKIQSERIRPPSAQINTAISAHAHTRWLQQIACRVSMWIQLALVVGHPAEQYGRLGEKKKSSLFVYQTFTHCENHRPPPDLPCYTSKHMCGSNIKQVYYQCLK